ncbi:MAG: zinc ribbon domain-containing protein [Methanobrevibacter sp.]|nr:zinc ribbon domain-containing protein [Methanobrevibacter sp.]
MVVCPDCGKEVPDANFCKNCGAALPEKSEIVEVEDATPVETEVVETIPVVAEEVETEEEIPSSSSNGPKFCHSCGFKLDGNYKFCPNCGYDLENKTQVRSRAYDSVVTTEEKSVLVSVILSIIIPGLGHFYLGLSRKGAIFLLAYVVSAILILLLIGFILVLVIWIWALVDVIQSTNALNNGESVEDKLL